MAYSQGNYVGVDALGGFQVDEILTKFAFRIAQPATILRQFLDLKVQLGRNEGDTVYRVKWGNIDTAGSALAESSTIPTDRSVPLTRATATVQEFGNSISLTGRLRDLSNIDAIREIGAAVRNDYRKTINTELYTNIFSNMAWKYVGTATGGNAITTDSTATATNASVLNAYHIRRMRKKLVENNVPPWDDMGNYAFIGSPTAILQVQEDTDFKNYDLWYRAGAHLTGEVARFNGIIFIQASIDLDDSIGTSSNSGEGFLVGRGFGTDDMVLPAEIRTNAAIAAIQGRASDFGRTIDVGWYEMAAFGHLWNDAAQCHGIHWTSA